MTAAPKGEPRIGLLAKQAPPPKAAGARRGIADDIEALIPELRGHRGDWYLVGEFPTHSTASAIAKKLTAKYDGKLEAEARNPEKGRSALWLRWVGTRNNTGTDR